MKKIFITVMMLSVFGTYCWAVERKPLIDVDTDEFTSDTQVSAIGAGDGHVAFAWWIPKEYWISILSRDASTSEIDKNNLLELIKGISMLAVVQADVSKFGAFVFYSKEEIERNLAITYSHANDKNLRISPLQMIDPDLEVVLGILKPILGTAMGNLGNNMHFFVLSDGAKYLPRLIDPYQKGQIDIKLARKDQGKMTASIELPLNCLFIPRKCPNGKNAHISWSYCPWTGKRLEE